MSRPVLLALAALLAPACAVRAPEGVFACTGDEQCPPGMTCSGGYCYRPDAGGPSDAPVSDTSALDVPLDDVPGLDAPDGGGGCDPTPPTLARSRAVGSDAHTEAHGALLRPGALFLPLHHDGTLASVGPSSGGFDGVLAVLNDDDALSSEGTFSGSNDAFLRAVTPRSGGGFYVTGEAVGGVQPPGGSPQTFVAGTTVGFLHRDDGRTVYLAPASGGLVRPLTVAERDDGASVCVGGIFRGSFTVGGSGRAAQADAGFVVCWDSDLRVTNGFVVDGTGDDSVDALLADGTSLYVAGTFTAGAEFPGLGAPPSPRSNGGDGFVLRIGPGGVTMAHTTFGGTGSAVASAVHALALGPADRLFAAGMLAPGDDPGLSVTHSGNGTDALLVALDRSSLEPRWAEVEDRGVADRHRALAIDRCGRPVVGGALGGVSAPARMEELTPVVRGYSAEGSAARWALDGSTGGIVRGMLRDDAGRLIVVGRSFGALSFVLTGGSSSTLPAPLGASSVFVLELLD